MQQVMPPETYGVEGHAMYEPSYYEQHEQEVPQTPQSQTGDYTPSRQIGYREDYSRTQHALLAEGGRYESPGRARSEPGVSQQEHLRFSAHVNRFATHDPRTTPVQNNRGVGVSVSERIKRFSSSFEDADTRPSPPSPQRYQQQMNQQYKSAPPNAMQKQMQQEQAPRSAPSRQQHTRPSPESSYRRHQEMAQDHYASPSPGTRQYQHEQQASPPPRSYLGGTSAEPTPRRSERRSQALAASRSHSRDRIERERRSQSPVPRSSPSRISENQRAARSLLAKRRQHRLEREEKEQQTPRRSEVNDQMNATPVSAPVVKKARSRDEGRTDRILKEARSRSASPRTSRYSRKSLATPLPNTDLWNDSTPQKSVRITDHRGSTPERFSQSRSEYQTSTPTTPGRATRAKNYQSGSHIAMRQQESVSPITPASPVSPVTNTTQKMPESPASDQSPALRNSRGKNSGDTITSAASTVSTVQELKRQLWDNNEKLHVSVQPSLHAHGYSDRRTKQTMGYYAPEMAGTQGQRVRSLSPNPKHDVHGHERPASHIEPPSYSSAMFNSKYMEAARASTREGYSPPERSDDVRATTSSPQEKTDEAAKPSPRRSRHQLEDRVHHRTESPLPPIPPAGRASSDEDFHSPRAGMSPVPSSATHSIERVPSSAGVSTATGEVSVTKLVAKLSSVSREDPALALQMIDSILRAESKNSSAGTGSRTELQSMITLASQKETNAVDESAEHDQNDDDESAASSFDDSTSVSSITNPTYQRDDKAHGQFQSTSNSRNPRPSSLNKYSQLRPTGASPPEEERGKSRKAKKEKKPPPPATIKVNKSDLDRPNGNKEKSSSKREKKEKSNTLPKKVRGLSPTSSDDKRDRRSKPNGTGMDAAAIALKIQGWDDQINNSMEEPPVGMVSLADTPLSPTRTEDTTGTEGLGSILTPTSNQQIASESRRSHPWDDNRPQSNRKARAIDLPIGTYMDNGFGADEEMVKAFEPASPWQRRRAAKRETDDREEPAVIDSGENTEANKGNSRDSRSRSRSSTPRTSLSNSRIAPNVYDVHRKRRSRSGSRDRKQNSASPSRRNAQQERGNPFYSVSTKSETRNPFDPSYTNPFSSSKSDVGTAFDSAYKRKSSGSKSDAGNVFDSAWVALPADAFSGATPESQGTSPDFPDDANFYGTTSAPIDLPPRTPTNRAPFGKEEAPEASRDPNDSGSKPRRSFLRRRSSTPKKDRTPVQKQNKPLLSAHAMDSVTNVKDEFKVRQRPSRSQGRRGRTLSPAPRKVMKSKSPGRNRLKSRNKSFADDGEDESSSLTGSLTGSTASSVRNKNLAKKFSRFLKVYED